MKNAIFLMTLIAVSTLFFVLIINSSLAESNTVLIKVGDLYFKPDIIQLKAGQEVKIELVNEGKIEHEFMVGRGVKIEEGKNEAREEMLQGNEEKQETSEVEHEHHEGMHSAHTGMSRGFENDFFEGIKVVVQTDNGAEFMDVPGHGTMLTLKPEGKSIIIFKVPTGRKGEWEMACFVPGHYEAKMKGKVIVN